MKSVLVLAPVLAILFSVLTHVCLEVIREPSPEAGEELAARQSLELRLAELQTRQQETLERLERRLDLLESHSRESGGRQPAAGNRGFPGGSLREGAAAGGSGEGADLAELAGRIGRDGDAGAALRDFVVEVIGQERVEREERARQQANRAREEEMALHQGPYGKYNYRINKIGKKLGLDDWQRQRYHQLLTRYGAERQRVREEAATARQSSPAPDASLVSTRLEELNAEFDRDFATVLDREQQELYEALPPHEKGASSSLANRLVFTSFVPAVGVEDAVILGEGATRLTIEADTTFEAAVSGDEPDSSPDGGDS